MARSCCRKTGYTVVVIFGKYSHDSTSSDHNTSFTSSHLQTILIPSPKTTKSQLIMTPAQVISFRSMCACIPQMQQFRLHFSNLNTRELALAPTQPICNEGNLTNVDTIVQKGGKQEAHSNHRSVSNPESQLGTWGQFLLWVQLCCFVLWLLALPLGLLVLPFESSFRCNKIGLS